MADDVSDIANFYNNDPEREHIRLVQHQLEYDLTWRYLEKYLPSRATILEIGAATGRYTLELARRGYTVTAVDMSAGLVELSKQNLVNVGLADRVRLFVADARDLSSVPGDQFDAVLLMGPLYHLVEEADRILALTAAIERMRTGGILVSAFISRFGIMGDLLKTVPAWVEDQAEVRAIMAMGRDPDHHPMDGFRGYFAQVAEIAPLHESLGLETLVLAGVEPGISADDESYNNLPENLRPLWLDLFYEMSTEVSIIGASRHLLYVGRKRDDR